MKKTIIATALATTLIGGAALAAQETGAVDGMAKAPGVWMAHRGDTNGDGVITRDEALADAAKRFDAADTNHDGKVTPEEMRAARMAHRGGHARGLGGPEGPGGPEDMHGPGSHGDMLARLDTNGDGKISEAEFNAPHDRMFQMIDTNHDGQIDEAEMQAAKAKMEARMQQMRGRWYGRGGPGGPGGDMPPPPPPPGNETPGQ